MKQIFKKVSSLCTVLLMMAVLTLTGASSVWAADEVDDSVKQTLVTTAEGLTDTIIALSDEDIENYTKSSLIQIESAPISSIRFAMLVQYSRVYASPSV